MTTSDTNEVASHELPATPLDPELAAKRAEKIKVSMISLCGCWGCSLSLLDIDERMIDLLDKITILRSSFTDIKRIPERCAIGFIEGGVANEDEYRDAAALQGQLRRSDLGRRLRDLGWCPVAA